MPLPPSFALISWVHLELSIAFPASLAFQCDLPFVLVGTDENSFNTMKDWVEELKMNVPEKKFGAWRATLKPY